VQTTGRLDAFQARFKCCLPDQSILGSDSAKRPPSRVAFSFSASVERSGAPLPIAPEAVVRPSQRRCRRRCDGAAELRSALRKLWRRSDGAHGRVPHCIPGAVQILSPRPIDSWKRFRKKAALSGGLFVFSFGRAERSSATHRSGGSSPTVATAMSSAMSSAERRLKRPGTSLHSRRGSNPLSPAR